MARLARDMAAAAASPRPHSASRSESKDPSLDKRRLEIGAPSNGMIDCIPKAEVDWRPYRDYAAVRARRRREQYRGAHGLPEPTPEYLRQAMRDRLRAELALPVIGRPELAEARAGTSTRVDAIDAEVDDDGILDRSWQFGFVPESSPDRDGNDAHRPPP